MKTAKFPVIATSVFLVFLTFAALPDARAGQIDFAGPPAAARSARVSPCCPTATSSSPIRVMTHGPIHDVGAVHLYDGVTARAHQHPHRQHGERPGRQWRRHRVEQRQLSWCAARFGITARDRRGRGDWGSGTTGVTGVVSAAKLTGWRHGQRPSRQWRHYGVDQWQLRGEQPVLGQRSGGNAARRRGSRDDRRDRCGLDCQFAGRRHGA